MAWNRSVRTRYNQIAQGGERDDLFFALGFYLYLILWYRHLFNKNLDTDDFVPNRHRGFCIIGLKSCFAMRGLKQEMICLTLQRNRPYYSSSSVSKACLAVE